MLRCLSIEQMEDLIWGRMDAVLQEAAGAHLEQCDACRRRFLELTELPDADSWRLAALELPPPSAADEELLERFKQFAKRRSNHEAEPPRVVTPDPAGEEDSESVHEELVAPLPGSRLGQRPVIPGYEILGELGRGGMGVVYKARQVAQDRLVALKMIHSGRETSPEDLGRFHDEAEAISRLRHPHIVQIYEVGEVKGRYYFVLEFVEGGTLADQIQGRPIPPRPAAQLVEALARAMHYAHQRGIIHRDLKPGNVLLHGRRVFSNFPDDIDRQSEEWDFRRFMPKITDFGLAKLLDRGDQQGHTSSGDVVGTPSYMAPEQAQGQAHLIGPRTDVYALGAILYEMLTGRPPFQGATPMDTLFQVHSAEPIPPRQLVREVPVDLETICLKCLRKDPSRRYPTAEALADDLRRFLDGSPIRTQGVRRSTSDRTRRWLHRAGMALAAVALGGLAGLAAFEFRRRFASSSPPPISPLGSAATIRGNSEFRLRLRLAQAECERGDIVHGVGQMIGILREVETTPDGAAWRDCLNTNIQAWMGRLPRLDYVSTVPVRDFDIDGSSADVLFLTSNREMRRVLLDGSNEPLRLPEVDDARSFSLSSSGAEMAAVSPSGLRWWDWHRGEVLHRVPHLTGVALVTLSPDGHAALIRADREGNALWLLRRNPMTKSLRTEPLRVDRSATCWTWHPSGDRVLVGYADGRVEIISTERADSRQEVRRGAAGVTGLAWIRQGQIAVVAAHDGFIRFASPGAGPHSEELAPIRAHPPGPVIIAASGSDTVVSAGVDRHLRIWSAAQGQCLSSLPTDLTIQKLILSADQRRMAALDSARTLRSWSLPEREFSVVPFGVESCQAEVSSNGRALALLVNVPRRGIRLGRREGANVKWVDLPIKANDEIVAFRFQPGSMTLGVLARQNGRSRLDRWNLNEKAGESLDLGAATVETFEFSPDGKAVIAVAPGSSFIVCDLESRSVRVVKAPDLKDVSLLRISPDRRHFVISSPQATEVWAWSEPPRRIWTGSFAAVDARWSADSTELLLWNDQYDLSRWSVTSGWSKSNQGDNHLSDWTPPPWTAIRPGPDSTLLWQHQGRVERIAHWPAAERRKIRWPEQGNIVLTVWQDGVRLIDGETGVMLGPTLEFSNVLDAMWNETKDEILAWSTQELRVWKWLPSSTATAAEWQTFLERRIGMAVASDGLPRPMMNRQTSPGNTTDPATTPSNSSSASQKRP